LQPWDPKTMAPIWKELTGITLNVIELPPADMYTKVLAEHIAGTGAYDIININIPEGPDFVKAGALEPLDPYIEKYMNPADLEDFPEVFQPGLENAGYGGKIYALRDDGDAFILYYRKDLFQDEANQAEFKAKYGYDLLPPTTWKEFQDVGEFFTAKFAPDLYGGAIQRQEGANFFWFIGQFSGNGGQFFDPETMKPEINSDIGVQTLTEMVKQNEFMPPGVQKWGFAEVLSAWLDGKLAMVITWPPIGRWSAGYGTRVEQLSWIPETKVAGKVGYVPMPGGRPSLAGGFQLGVSSDSKNKEAAYLTLQWLNSPEISLQRVLLPYALRDPFRLSHFSSPLYRSAWDEAGEYLDTLRSAQKTGQREPVIPGARQYEDSLERAITAAFAGSDPKEVLDIVAKEWEDITERLGRQAQIDYYKSWIANDPWLHKDLL